MNMFKGRKTRNGVARSLAVAAVVVAAGGAIAVAGQDEVTAQVPGGLAMSEFRGYEDWSPVNVSHPADKINVIVANPTMIAAYRAGIPGNGKPFPEGSRAAKIHWKPKKSLDAPELTTVSDTLTAVGFMVKDSKRFPDTGGWGYAMFDYEPATETFSPNTSIQGKDAKCGAGCHTIAAKKDFVFTEYPRR